ncbi:MAG: IclR family transcriptional regulator [Rhodobacteraceae bacterium]|nr:IclR family transcriptional regulator [Paracoccaceae bacterium]
MIPLSSLEYPRQIHYSTTMENAVINQPERQRQTGLDRTLQVLDILTEQQQPMSAYQIAMAIRAPTSTIYRTVDEMLSRGLLSHAGEKEVWLGPRLMRYGLLYRSKLDFFMEARKEMELLRQRTGESVQICGRDEGMMVVLAMAEGEGHFRVISNVGTRVPLNWTASGKLLLGHLSASEATALFAAYAKPSPTGRAETDPVLLAKQARDDFSAGLSIQRSDSEYSVACIASPIRDRTGVCRATISIVLSEKQVDEKGANLMAAVQDAAAAIESRIGH